jgi:hypothetical protein
VTEAQWLAATGTESLLPFISERVSARKLRLATVACCRCIWHLLADERCRGAVEAAEHNADGRPVGAGIRAFAEEAGRVAFGRWDAD